MKFLLIFLLIFVFISCEESKPEESTFKKIELAIPYNKNLEINSFFSPFDNLDLVVLEVLDTAQSEVIIAQYNIRRESILKKLVELANRGVSIRVVVDQRNAAKDYNTGDDFLEENGIEILRTKPSGRYALMHLKSTVIDNKIVMTGSYNWSSTATLANNENMVVINNEDVATKYRNQIIEILDGGEIIEGGKIDNIFEVHYSPEEKLYKTINLELSKAKKSIDIAMFTFTRTDIAKKLKEATERGVKVRVIMEKKQFNYSMVDEFFKKYPDILLVEAANKVTPYSAMHNKYAIIDNRKVITGASNWTSNGTKESQEDILIINNRETAIKYTQNFNDLLNIYAKINKNFDGELIRENSPVSFHIINDKTEFGDRVFITGSSEELGNWNPFMGVEAFTSESMFPNWATSVYLPINRKFEYKIVIIKADNSIVWEDGANREIKTLSTGRAISIGGEFGDTTKVW